jgi:hypothetical protein
MPATLLRKLKASFRSADNSSPVMTSSSGNKRDAHIFALVSSIFSSLLNDFISLSSGIIDVRPSVTALAENNTNSVRALVEA